MDTLYLTQYACMIIMAVLAFVMMVTHFYVRRPYRLYEQSRWMLVAALLLFVLHYWLQMHYGFRAQGADVGAVVNILFYAPISFLFCLSLLHFVRGDRGNASLWWISIGGYAAILAIVIEGWWRHDSLHIGEELYVADAIYLICIALHIILPYKELANIRRRVEAETGNPLEVFEQCLRWGMVLMYTLVAAFQFTILYTPLMNVVAPLVLLAIGFYVTCFVSMGFNVSQLAEVIDYDTDEKIPAPADDTTVRRTADRVVLRAEDYEALHQAINQWISEGGLRDSEASIVSLARQLGVPRQHLTAYLNQKHGCTFRIWLSKLRLQEAQRLMIENPGYSNDIIAQECGFASSSQLYRVFRTATGCTPREWADGRMGKRG